MASKYTISTAFKGIDNMTKPVRKMTGSIRSMTETAETGLRKIDTATESLSSSLFGIGKKAATGIAGLSAAMVVGAGAVNSMKVESDNMSKSMGANIQTVEAITSVIKGIGLNAENVTDLYEEMNNKLGESAGIKEITSVTESLGILGLEYRNIQKLSPEDQFKAITNAALSMKDATQAAAASDMLMGSEANKIISTLRTQGRSIEDIIGNYEILSFRTDKSRKGAEDMAKAQSKTAKIMGSLTQEISGLIGSALAPMIVKFNEFMIGNKGLISQNIDKLFNSIGKAVGDITPHLESVVNWIGNLDTNFSKFMEWAKWVGMATLAVGGFLLGLKVFIGVMTAVNLVMAANPFVLMTVAVIALGAAFAYAANMIYQNWDGISDYFSDLFGGISDMFDSTVGSIMGKIDSAKDFFGFGDEDDININKSMMIDSNSVVTQQERISRSISENKETFDINVHGKNGATLSSSQYSPRLNLINTGN